MRFLDAIFRLLVWAGPALLCGLGAGVIYASWQYHRAAVRRARADGIGRALRVELRVGFEVGAGRPAGQRELGTSGLPRSTRAVSLLHRPPSADTIESELDGPARRALLLETRRAHKRSK